MAGAVKLAVAGSGKTTWIGKNVDTAKRNLLITFTNQNVKNIQHAIKKANREQIPENTQVMTYTRFVYYWLLRPFEPSIAINKRIGQISSRGIDIQDPPEFNHDNMGNGYIKECFTGHYISKGPKKLYSSRLSKLYIKQSAAFRKNARARLALFLDNLYVDEFQDFCGFDFKLLMDLIACSKTHIVMVGDYFQSMVSQTNQRNSLPYKQTKDLTSFKSILKSRRISVDEETLKKSWRCPSETCDFIRNRLRIPIEAAKYKPGKVVIVEDTSQAAQILLDSHITKLLWNANVKGYQSLNPVNKWGYSKGDEYPNTCVVLTSSADSLIENAEIKLKPSVLHKLYVALTRSLENTYVIPSNIYKQTLTKLQIT